jgi:ABC-type sugar transport system permease subunit
MNQRLWKFQHRYAPYLFTLPFVLLFCIFLLYPLGRSLVMSLYKSAGPRSQFFVGLGNYRYLMQDKLFWLAVANTTGYTIVFLTIQIPASLGLAILLNSPFVKGRNFFRFAFFSTHLVGAVFVGVIFNLLFARRTGMVNQLLSFFTSEPVLINWLEEPNLVMVVVVIASLWLSIGFGMIYFLAALQAVDRDLYEAAEVDGAGPSARFWHITLPGIRPVLIFMILVGTISAFQLFELPYVLFPGDMNPRALTIVMYMFIMGFGAGDLGYAAAIGWVLVLLILAIALLQLRFTRANEGGP